MNMKVGQRSQHEMQLLLRTGYDFIWLSTENKLYFEVTEGANGRIGLLVKCCGESLYQEYDSLQVLLDTHSWLVIESFTLQERTREDEDF